MHLLGYDIGSSSIKASLLEAESGRLVASATAPATELDIHAPRPGWAEQDPEVWWQNVVAATRQLRQNAPSALDSVAAIGIAYQMHGLVVVDKSQKVLRPAIIWCDSRAVESGELAAERLGRKFCLKHLLNYPGNFTASKLKWLAENEPNIFARVHKFMLPGEYIAMKLSGEIRTTASGLSEGVFWDFAENKLSDALLNTLGFSKSIVPDVTPTFAVQGELTRSAAQELGLKPGVKISYRAGDQPNNALALNVLRPGEIAANAGTSGVVYGVSDKICRDELSRVNVFAHVNYSPDHPLYGVLLCLNGTGSLYRWMKNNATEFDAGNSSYEKMNRLAAEIPPGAEDLNILPYGNGAERTLGNRAPGASVNGLDFNRHTRAHLFRAANEGIVFSFRYGLEIMRDMGINVSTAKAGYSNMFLSELFAKIFASSNNITVELYNTDGAQGAARGAGIGAGIYKNFDAAFARLDRVKVIEPEKTLRSQYEKIYQTWREYLELVLRREA